MKLALLLALALPVAAGGAVNPCTGLPIPAGVPINWYTDFGANTAPWCFPVASPISTRPYLSLNSEGVVAYHYCKVGPTWKYSLYVATWSFLLGKNLAADFQAATLAPEPFLAFIALTKANVGLPLSDPNLTKVWCPVAQEIWANTPKGDSTQPLVWKTPKPGGTGTLYTWGPSGLTSIIPTRTAPPNVACDPSVKVSRGTATFMPVLGAPQTEVTLCIMTPQ
jgi:hypothetical protein